MSIDIDSTKNRPPMSGDQVPELLLRSVQIRQLYSQVRMGMFASAVAGFGLAALLWQAVPRERVLGWLIVFLAVQIPRHILLQRFRRNEPVGVEALPWGKWFLLGSGATSLLFGLSAVFIFPSDSFVHQCALAILLGGVAASTAVAHAPLTECYVSSVLLSLFPLLGRFLYQGGESGPVLAAVGLAFAAALLGTANSLHRMIVTSIQLRFQRDEMLGNLKQAHQLLEDRVAERTAELASKNDELFKEVTERKRAEEALRVEKNRFQVLAQHLPLGLVAISDDGSFHYVNQKFCELFGYDPDEVPDGRHWFRSAYPDPEYRSQVISAWVDDLEKAKPGEQRPREFTVTCKDGSRKTVLFRSVQLNSSENLMTCEDVTERKRTERAIEEHISMLEAILDGAADGICVCHNIDEFPFVRFSHWNPRMTEITGYTVEEINKLGWYQTMYPSHDIRQAVEERLARMLVGDDIKAEEWGITTKDGTDLSLSISTSIIEEEEGKIHIVAIMQDITQRKRDGAALRDSEEKYRTLVEESFDGIFIQKGSEIVFANSRLFEMLGYSESELLGIDHWRIYHPDYHELTRSRAQARMRGESVPSRYEVRLQRRDGASFDGEINAKDVTVEGEPGIQVWIRDITERKKAEEALRESEATLRTLLQAAPIGIGQLSADRTLGWTNQLLCTMVGYSGEELEGQSSRILYESDEEFLSVGRKKHPEVIRHGTGSVETRFRRRDGSVFHVLLSSSSVVRGDLSQGMVFTAMDITERKRAEAQIKLNEERLQSLYDISQYKAETIQDLLDFALNEAVKLAESKLGYIYRYDEEKKLFELNTWSKEVMQECEVAEPQSLYELDKTGIWGEAVRQRKPIVVNDFHAPNALKKGYPKGHVELHNFMTIPVFEGNKIVAVVGVGNKDSDYDESDLRQLTLLMDSVWRIAAGKSSELAQRRSATALEHAAEGVIITDTDGTIQYVNSSLERMTGYSQDELLGNNPRLLKSGEQNAAFYEQLWRTIKGGNIWTGRFINKRKDGTLYTEDATISPVRDALGNITGFVGMKRDITEHLTLSRQLAHAQKMEAIGTLAGGMAHDFNNILQAILGYSDLILLKRGKGDPDRKKLEVIHQAARDGADLVSRILTFSRKSESKRRPVDLNEEIRKAQRLLRRTIQRMTDIRLVLAENLRIIDADPSQMEQVLLNLAINAHHAMPDGGQLLIETSNVSLSDGYLRTHLGAKAGRYVLLTVSDTGEGMEADVLDRIFEPFFTTKTNVEGTGLGLSMVHGIVTQHGGYIKCYSEPGKGTSFKIYLPVSDREPESDLYQTREMPAFGTETILLVDDDDRIREMGRQIIEMGGYKVLLARSGEEALEIYSLSKEEIALIVLDLIMPGMGGSRCLEELLRMAPNVKVLLASGYSSNGLTHDYKGSGARGFVNKPYDAKDILSAIRKVLDKGYLSTSTSS